MVVLHRGNAIYWVVNSLLNNLSNETMIAIAKGLKPLPAPALRRPVTVHGSSRSSPAALAPVERATDQRGVKLPGRQDRSPDGFDKRLADEVT